MQYYDSAARYFRRLTTLVPVKVDYVEVDAPDQIERILDRARKTKAAAVAVR